LALTARSEVPVRVVPVLGVVALTCVAGALAQQPLLTPGERVRVTAPEAGVDRLAATVEGFDGTVLTVRADSTIRMPVHLIGRLDRYAGRHNRRWRGAAFGAAGGAVIGGVVGYLACENYEVTLAGGGTGNCFDSRDGGQLALWGPLGIGVVAGPLLGFLIGTRIVTDRWEEVPLEHLRVGVAPQRDGVGVGVQLRF
jgi:hypothetical protein